MAATLSRRTPWGTRIAATSAAALALAAGFAGCGASSKPASVADGVQRLSAGDAAGAQQIFERVLQRDPDNAQAIYNLGYIDYLEGNRHEAESEYRKSLAIDPRNELALYNLAVALTAEGNDDEAISLLRRAVAIDDKDPKALFNLGLLLRRSGDPKGGDAQVRRAIALDPTLEPQAAALGLTSG